MRKFIVLVAFAAVAAIAPTQAAAHHTTAHALTQTRAKLNALHNFVHNCLGWQVVPLAVYGDPEGEQGDAQGYVYDAGPENILTTSLDLAPSVNQSTFVVAAVRPIPACVGRLRRPAVALRTDHSVSLARKALRLG
jgi:hypothetical protein